MKKFFLCESGQATVEYSLLVMIMVGIVVTVGIAMRNKLRELFDGPLGSYIQKNFFSPDSLHRLPVRIPR